jgi:hypothetical protein
MRSCRPLLSLLYAAGLIAFLATPTFAQDTPKWGPHFDVELKPGLHRSLMEGDLFLPVTQDADTLVFGDLRARFDDESAHEGNFGMGIRQMVNPSWILGGYGYYDRRTTGLGSEFEQMTLGLEALGRDWEFRTNLYVPFGSTVNGSSDANPSLHFAPGGVVQLVAPGSERALGGFDAEVGYRLPLFDVEDGRQWRVFAGGFRFEDDTTHVTGPRVRTEFVLEQVPGLWKGAQMTAGLEYQDDNARGSQSFASLRLRIPFGGRDNAPSLTAQERRMTAPTVRDVDIVTQAAPRVVVDVPQTAAGQTLKGYSTDTTTGARLPTDVGNAGDNSTVLLSGTFNMTSAVTLRPGQTLMGVGTLDVLTASGRFVTVTTPAATIIKTGSSTPIVRMANNSTLTGMTLVSRDASVVSGVSAIGVSGASIANNRIHVIGSSTAQAVQITNSSGTSVRNNEITAQADTSAARGFTVVNSTDVQVADNTVSTLGSAPTRSTFAIQGTSSFTSDSTGNVQVGGDCTIMGGTITGSIGVTGGGSCP